jgi:hypothetical protein
MTLLSDNVGAPPTEVALLPRVGINPRPGCRRLEVDLGLPSGRTRSSDAERCFALESQSRPRGSEADDDPNRRVGEAQNRLLPRVVGAESRHDEHDGSCDPAVTTSSDRPITVSASVPMPISAIKPRGWNGKSSK